MVGERTARLNARGLIKDISLISTPGGYRGGGVRKFPSWHHRWKPPTISVRLDFLKCVQICIFFKSQI